MLSKGSFHEELALPGWEWGGVGVSKLKIRFVFHTSVRVKHGIYCQLSALVDDAALIKKLLSIDCL